MHPEISPESLLRYLRIDECHSKDLEAVIDSAVASAKNYTGYDLSNNGEKIEYFTGVNPCIFIDNPKSEWTLEYYNGSEWEKYPAKIVGDRLCLKGLCVSPCLSCPGAPSFKLTTYFRCGVTESNIIFYVKEYVAYMWNNRGNIDPSKLSGLLKILYPHRTMAVY